MFVTIKAVAAVEDPPNSLLRRIEVGPQMYYVFLYVFLFDWYYVFVCVY